MPLEGADRRESLVIETAAGRQCIAIEVQHGLQGFDRRATLARREEAATADGLGQHPVSHAQLMQPPPGKMLARIALAPRGDVGMGEDMFGSNVMAGADIVRQSRNGLDLRNRVGRQVAVVPVVHDLDADGGGVDVADGLPLAGARVPGAVCFGHHLQDLAVLLHHVVAGHFRCRIAQPCNGACGIGHAGVMQDQQGRALLVAAHPEVGRGMQGTGERGVGQQHGPCLARAAQKMKPGTKDRPGLQMDCEWLSSANSGRSKRCHCSRSGRPRSGGAAIPR